MIPPFGSWKSPLSAEELTRGVKGFADLQCAADQLVLLESRPEEAGRNTLLLIDPSTPQEPGIELSPSPLNVRSRVHEYGGGAFLATEDAVYFVNFSDQNIYVVALQANGQELQPTPPVQLTRGDAHRRYADFSLDASGGRLIAVCELHEEASAQTHSEPQNLLISIDLATGEESTLHAGHDFYAAPRVNPKTSKLAFVAWDHPAMPWDATVLYQGLLSHHELTELHKVDAGPNESISQPSWLQNSALAFVSDRNGFWNLYARATAEAKVPARCLYADDAEYASPAWVFGQREHVQLKNGDIAAVRQVNGVGELCLLSPNDEQYSCTVIDKQFAGYHALCTRDSQLYALADSVDGFASLIAIDLTNHTTRIVRKAGEFSLQAIARPEAITITNRDDLPTHAWLYLPSHQDADGTPSTTQSTTQLTTETKAKPPLLVLSHGGPTSSTSPALNPRIQYYTSRGWAVVDVNYGGSTGYGRAYRERLRDSWGLVDVRDCEDVALALAAAGRVDPKRMAIKGGSAGGYTTLAALTFGDVFAAGASHYGIGDLNALAAETHKFEARYVDGLIPADEWEARSPINYVDSLACPVIFFQGSEDAVVPPGQAQAMVAALTKKGLPVAYVEFEGEGHGFRNAKNIQHAAAAEYQFFCKIFGIDCPDDPVALTIENLS